MQTQFRSLFEYSAWVNERLLDTASLLTPEQFKQKVLLGSGSVYQTFVHLIGAEEIWFARWQGQSPKSILSEQDLPDLAAIRARHAALADARRANLLTLNETAFDEVMHWTNMRGQPFTLLRWQVILHCINHSTHHRSEIAAMLTQLGHEPEPTELLQYYLDRAGQAWQPTNLKPT